jgi:hypothetical protein
MADIPSLIKLLLPTQVTGYTSPFPRYAASSCTTCAAYPKAVATASSFTSWRLCSESGGAGSVGESGMGRGTERMVKRRSGGERSSIGWIVETVDRRALRVGAKRRRRVVSRSLGAQPINAAFQHRDYEDSTLLHPPLVSD